MKAIIHPNEHAPHMFKNKFLEKLTWSNPVLIFVMYSIIAVCMIRYSVKAFDFSLTTVAFVGCLGFLTWSLAEYLLHRFLYHNLSDSSYHKGFQYLFHGVHHTYPNDQEKIVLPPVPSLLIAGLFFGFYYVIMGKYAFLFGPGFLLGYSVYMWIHSMVHKKAMPAKFNFWWKHHNIHHYQQFISALVGWQVVNL